MPVGGPGGPVGSVVLVCARERRDVEEPTEERPAVEALAVVERARTRSGSRSSRGARPRTRARPAARGGRAPARGSARRLAHLAPREAHRRREHFRAAARSRTSASSERGAAAASAAAARRASGRAPRREPVRDRDVLERHLDVLDALARRARRVFTSRWCWCRSAIVRISVRYFSWSRRVRVRSSRNVSSRRVRVHDRERPQQPLRVLVERSRTRSRVSPREQALERLALALELVDRPRLLALLVDRQHEAAVQRAPRRSRPPSSSGRSSPAPRRGTPASRACPSPGPCPSTRS